MPIIEPPDESEHLLQGDILQGVHLYATQDSWHDGGKSAKTPYDLCLVLSRSCAARHKSRIVVAGVAISPDNVPRDLDCFEETHAFLTDMRDGSGSPDVFYLGQFPGREGRFSARLDALFSVKIPSNPDELTRFLREQRIGSLNVEFVRDLHIRMFMAFARLGFSDEGWLSDDDLNWLVESGKGDLLKAKAELQEARTAKAKQRAAGKQFSDRQIPKLEERLTELQEQVEPYIREKQSRDERSDAEE